MTDTSTTPPYSGSQSSSTPTTTQQYTQPLPLEAPQNKESIFNRDWITVITTVIVAIIWYFVFLMDVKSDIAENQKDISVTIEKVVHITTGLSDLKKDLDILNRVQRKTDELLFRVNTLEKSLEKHSSHYSHTK